MRIFIAIRKDEYSTQEGIEVRFVCAVDSDIMDRAIHNRIIMEGIHKFMEDEDYSIEFKNNSFTASSEQWDIMEVQDVPLTP